MNRVKSWGSWSGREAKRLNKGNRKKRGGKRNNEKWRARRECVCWGSRQSWWGCFFFFFDQEPAFYPRQSAQRRSGKKEGAKEGGEERRRESRQPPLSAECQHLQLPPPPSHLTFLSALQCKYITTRRCVSHRKADCVCATDRWGDLQHRTTFTDFLDKSWISSFRLKADTPQFHHIHIKTALWKLQRICIPGNHPNTIDRT